MEAAILHWHGEANDKETQHLEALVLDERLQALGNVCAVLNRSAALRSCATLIAAGESCTARSNSSLGFPCPLKMAYCSEQRQL